MDNKGKHFSKSTVRNLALVVVVCAIGYGHFSYLKNQRNQGVDSGDISEDEKHAQNSDLSETRYQAIIDLIKSPRGLASNQTKEKAQYYFSVGTMMAYEGNSTAAIEFFKKTLTLDPMAGHVHTKIAEEYLKKAELEVAKKHLVKALKQEPNSVQANLLMGGVYGSLRQYDKAKKNYNKVIQLEPENQKPYIFLSTIYSEEKKYPKALAILRALIKEEPQSFLAHYYMAKVYTEMDQEKRALHHFHQSLKINPGFQSAAIALGLYYETTRQTKKAVDVYMGVLEHTSRPRILRRAIQLLLAKKDYSRALKLLEDLKHKDPSDLNNRVRIGLIYFEIKKYKKARAEFEELLKEHPDSDRVIYYLSAVYEKSNSTKKAISLLKRVSEDSTLYLDATSHLVYLLRENKRYDEALGVVGKVLKKYPSQHQYYDLMASVYEKQENFKEAVGVLKRAVEKFPKEERLLYYLGAMHDKMDDTPNAIKAMKNILKINPKNADALNFIGYTYTMKNEKLDEAEKLILQALKLRPGEGYIEDSLGWVYYVKGEYKAAKVWLEKAVELKPAEAVILDHLADLYMKMGQTKKAYSLYLRAIKASPDRKTGKEIEEKLKAFSQKFEPKKRFPATSK